MKIGAVEFDRVGCFDRDDGDAILAAGAEDSAPGTLAACGGGSCGSGGVAGTKRTGAMLGGILRGRTSLGGTLVDGTSLETPLGGTATVGMFWGGTGLAGTVLGKTGLGGTWLLSAREASGALGRGT